MKKSKKIAVVGLFAAIIVLLQILSYVLPVGAFNLSLVLIPIIIGAVLYGMSTGVILGVVFGVVVTVACITGLDKGGLILWSANPFYCGAICLIKGAAAGFVAGAIGKLLKGKSLKLGEKNFFNNSRLTKHYILDIKKINELENVEFLINRKKE